MFEGRKYRHRDSSLGDSVAQQLFEDLYQVNISSRLHQRIESGSRVLNVQNTRRGVKARRGDGTFGELIPNTLPIRQPEFLVGRGPIATVEIGIEVKILAKAMMKQIDRVMSILLKQVDHFKRGAGTPICVGVVGVNHAERTTSYEGERAFPTDGKKYIHPVYEAAEATHRLKTQVAGAFDEFLIIPYRAENVPPYRFGWVGQNETEMDYGAILTRISREYDRRFERS